MLLRSNANFQEAFHLVLAEVYLAHVFCLFSIIFHSKTHLLPVFMPSTFDCIFPSTTLVATETTEIPQTAKRFRCGRNAQRREPSHANEIFLPLYTGVEDGEGYRMYDEPGPASLLASTAPSCFSHCTKSHVPYHSRLNTKEHFLPGFE